MDSIDYNSHEISPVTALDVIEYGLYALLATQRCTEDQIVPARAWLENAQECMSNYDWDTEGK